MGDVTPPPSLPLRYVVLWHDGVAEPHFDVMVETAPGSARLATWRAARWPVKEGDALVRLADHRATYLEYEGEVSGGRGHVRRVEQGTADMQRRGAGWLVRLSTGMRMTAPGP